MILLIILLGISYVWKEISWSILLSLKELPIQGLLVLD